MAGRTLRIAGWTGAAVAVLAALTAALWYPLNLQARSEKEAEERRRVYDQVAQDVIEYCSIFPVEGQLECLSERIRGAQENYRGENDLAAQRTMAMWTAAIGIVAIVGIPLTFGGILLLYGTLRETRRIGQAQVRAYISLSSVTLYPFGQRRSLSLDFANIGQSPARWVEVESNARALDIPENGWVFERDVEIDLTGRKQRWYVSGDQKHFGFSCHPKVIGGAEDDDDAIAGLIREAVSENKLLVLQGMLRWETVFGEVFETAFLFWQWPKAAKGELPKSAEGEGTPGPVSIRMIRPAMSRHLPTYQQVK